MDDPTPDLPADPPRVFDSESEPPPFWSPWATVGWGLAISLVFVIVQAVVVVVWGAVGAGRPSLDGDLIATGTLASAVICSSLVVALSAAMRGSRPRQSLGLTPPSSGSLGRWLAITAGLIVTSDLLTVLLDRPVVPEFMSEIVRTSSATPLLAVAIIIAAPFFEELFVRGFLIEGLRRGRLGTIGAVAVTSLFWASIHVQYGIYEIATIFVFGLVLGAARIISGSLWVPVGMHTLANLVATAEAVIAG